MAKLNQINLIGRLTKDPESSTVGADTSKCSFTIAVDRDYKKKDSNDYDADFFRCISWNKLAEIIETYSHKGMLVYISGSVQNRTYEQDGIKKYITEIMVNKYQMLDGKKKENRQESVATGKAENEADVPF